MTEELAQYNPKKLGWFRKYILMQDLSEIEPTMVSLYVSLYYAMTFGFTLWVVASLIIDYSANLNNLVSAKSTLHTSVYSQKSGKFNHELNGDWYVEINGKRIDYFKIFIGIGHNELATFERLDGESVEVQYLPENNKFYVIKFANSDVAHLATNQESISPQVLHANKITLARLKAMQHQNVYVMPFYALLSTLFFMFIEMLIIRYEVFRKPKIYFITQISVCTTPLLIRNCFVVVVGVGLTLLNLSIISNFIWRW